MSDCLLTARELLDTVGHGDHTALCWKTAAKKAAPAREVYCSCGDFLTFKDSKLVRDALRNVPTLEATTKEAATK